MWAPLGVEPEAWNGFTRQARAVPELVAAHDVPAVALSITELVILAVPFVGLAYVAYYVMRLALHAGSRLVAPTRRARDPEALLTGLKPV